MDLFPGVLPQEGFDEGVGDWEDLGGSNHEHLVDVLWVVLLGYHGSLQEVQVK